MLLARIGVQRWIMVIMIFRRICSIGAAFITDTTSFVVVRSDITRPPKRERILGNMVARASLMGIETPILNLARINVAAYEACRTRAAAPP